MVLWVGVRGIFYFFMGGCKRYTLWFYGWVEDIYLMVLWVGRRDIPYGFMCGCKKYTLWFYGWV